MPALIPTAISRLSRYEPSLGPFPFASALVGGTSLLIGTLFENLKQRM